MTRTNPALGTEKSGRCRDMAGVGVVRVLCDTCLFSGSTTFLYFKNAYCCIEIPNPIKIYQWNRNDVRYGSSFVTFYNITWGFGIHIVRH